MPIIESKKANILTSDLGSNKPSIFGTIKGADNENRMRF